MEKKLDRVKINMIVVVRMAIVEQVKNSVILLMVVNLNLVFVVVVKEWDHVMKMMVIAVVKKDIVAKHQDIVQLLKDVK